MADKKQLKEIITDDKAEETVSTFVIVRNIILAVLFIAAITFVSIKYTPEIMRLLKNTDKFRGFLLSYKNMGYVVFVAFQTTHILIPAIPGEVVQIAGGYVYGTILGSILLYIGMMLGTIIVFYTTRIIGYPLVKIFVSKKKMAQFEALTNSKKSDIVLFILFLLPGVPKDTLLYITGLMPIKPIKLILISTTARMPGVIGSAYIGANLLSRNYTAAIVVGIISVIMFIMGIIFRKKFFTLVNDY